MSGPPMIRWGVAGTGGIASLFVSDIRFAAAAEVTAVGSRAQAAADRFAGRFGIRRPHGCYASLAQDDDVDIIYVATPPATHHAIAIAAIRAGKSVLVEKPFTLDAAEAEEIMEAARDANVFLMEAMWTRHLPHMRRLSEILGSGLLGEIRMVTANHGLKLSGQALRRLYDPRLGGGALLDPGVYPISLACSVFGGVPETVAATTTPTGTGVDLQTACVLRYGPSETALISAAIGLETSNRAAIAGTAGRVEIPSIWYRPNRLEITAGGHTDVFESTVDGVGLWCQADEAARCLRAGRLQSDVLPCSATLAVMQTLDQIRDAIGLEFPPP